MSEVPPYQLPEPQAPPAKRSTTVLWVVAIVVIAGLCFIGILMAAVLFPVFSQAKLAAQKTHCLSNMKELALANYLYAADNNDRFPSAENWLESADRANPPSSPRICPLVAGENRAAAHGAGYAFNSALSDMDIESIKEPQDLILLFESSDTTPGASGTSGSLQTPGRHPGSTPGNVFAFADGHAKFITDGTDPGLWKP